MAKIGILGGTFDPVHNGHLALGKQAYEQFKLDEIWFMLSGHPPHKKGRLVTEGKEREDMVKLAIASVPYFVYSDFELKREGNTYTAQTLTLLREAYPQHEFYFIIGADSLYEIEQWYHPELVIKQAVLLAAARPYEKEHPNFEKQVKSSSKKFYKMEGYFFPDTYQFYLEEDPKNVAKKVCKNFEYKVTPDMYGRMEDLGMTLDETITLASIVQAEASSSIDMKLVSSVFHNRLNNPDQFPLLQSDPTTNYVEEVIKPNLEIYSQSMCDAYDTYKGGGLPPGAICNPGIEAIQAVLYPRETDYYYFCSDLDTGEFFFATTLDEHEANLVKAHLVADPDE